MSTDTELTFRRGCARCQWSTTAETRAEAKTAAEDHAAGAAHPLCCICHRSLPVGPDQTCLPCMARVRERLADLLVLYALLPAELAHSARPEAALVMLAPGGQAMAATFQVPNGQTWEEFVEANPTWWQTTGHGLQLPSDPESVAQTLGQWEDDWRGLQARLPAQTSATVSSASAYLNINLDWAAQHHPAFGEFAADIRRLHRRLENATAEGERPDRSEVDCFDCGQERLERDFKPARPCPHKPPPAPYVGPWRFDPKQHDRAWRAGHSCDQGGRVDVYTCGACGREYKPAEYWIAMRAAIETPVPPSSRPVVTVRVTPHDTPTGIAAFGLCRECGSPYATVVTTVRYPDGSEDVEYRTECAASRSHRRRA